MKLLTDDFMELFDEHRECSKGNNPTFVAKFYNPVGTQIWYVSDFDSKTKLCYGYVTGMLDNKWGYFSIEELEAIRLPYGKHIERDDYFDVVNLDAFLIREANFDTLVKVNRMNTLNKINNNKDIDQDLCL